MEPPGADFLIVEISDQFPRLLTSGIKVALAGMLASKDSTGGSRERPNRRLSRRHNAEKQHSTAHKRSNR